MGAKASVDRHAAELRTARGSSSTSRQSKGGLNGSTIFQVERYRVGAGALMLTVAGCGVLTRLVQEVFLGRS